MEALDKILTKLKNDEHYYGAYGNKYLSASKLKDLLKNPEDFIKEDEDNKAYAEGRYFHQLILEPDKAKNLLHVDVGTRNTKAYKEACQERNLSYIMLTKEKENVEKWVAKMKSNFAFFDDIYADGNKFEVPMVGKIMGYDFKGKADIVRDDCIIDLKTTGDINRFSWSANAFHYDIQAYIYQVLFGKPMKFYVIDKTTMVLGRFPVTQKFLDRGRDKTYRALQVYERYFSDNASEDVADFFIEEELQ